jgi:hypothetical protein
MVGINHFIKIAAYKLTIKLKVFCPDVASAKESPY